MHLKWKCLAKVSKFSMLLIIYGESVVARSLSTLRSNLERHLCSRGGPGLQLLVCRRAQQALGCPLFAEQDN